MHWRVAVTAVWAPPTQSRSLAFSVTDVRHALRGPERWPSSRHLRVSDPVLNFPDGEKLGSLRSLSGTEVKAPPEMKALGASQKVNVNHLQHGRPPCGQFVLAQVPPDLRFV
jgi:hypothetical protein